jgi:hypothetical protein
METVRQKAERTGCWRVLEEIDENGNEWFRDNRPGDPLPLPGEQFGRPGEGPTGMKQFRKKPITIEAVQITEATFSAPHPNPEHVIGVLYDPRRRCVFIDTLEGRMRGNLGDWIVRGIAGELYPVKGGLFAQLYEAVE